MRQSYSFIGKSVGVSLALLFLALLVGCDSGGGLATLQSIVVTPTNPSISKGATQQFTATGHFSNGTTQVLGTVTWSSGTTATATISGTGLATAVAPGNSTITATSGSVNGNTLLTVTAPTLQTITVTPANPSVGAGGTVQFTATGHFSDGSTQVLGSATWTSATTAAATIDMATGLATAVAVGSSTITASSAGINGTTLMTVTLAVPRLAITGNFGDRTANVYTINPATGQLRSAVSHTTTRLARSRHSQSPGLP